MTPDNFTTCDIHMKCVSEPPPAVTLYDYKYKILKTNYRDVQQAALIQ